MDEELLIASDRVVDQDAPEEDPHLAGSAHEAPLVWSSMDLPGMDGAEEAE
ncbi:MAG: hypothetical protein JSU08_09595 [Acidobacteria bacterium]|nr:hypothetical protein [Acidobacteriota bacterium]